jgi:hypothetical protein
MGAGYPNEDWKKKKIYIQQDFFLPISTASPHTQTRPYRQHKPNCWLNER